MQQLTHQQQQPMVFAQLAIDSIPITVAMGFRRKKLLDVGCSVGNGTALLMDYYDIQRCSGVDAEPYLLNTARTYFPLIDWIQADAFDGSFGSDAEILYCSNVLEHYDAPWIYFHNLLVNMPHLETAIIVVPYCEHKPFVEGHKVRFSFEDRNIPFRFDFRAAGHRELRSLHLVSARIKNLNSTGMWGGEQLVVVYHTTT